MKRNIFSRFVSLGSGILFLAITTLPGFTGEPKLSFVGASDTEFGNPHDLILGPNDAYLYVSDVDKNRIAVLDPKSLKVIGEFGADHQAGTHDIDFDIDGNAYVADTHNNRVLIYTVNGANAERIGELSENIRGPEGVLVHPDGRVYVAGAWSNNVVVYRNGEIVGELNGLSSPHDLAFDPNGDIWLADAGNHRLLLLSPELDVKKELSGDAFDFNGVRYLDLTTKGLMIAADKNNHAVKVISKDHRLIQVVGGSPGMGKNVFRTPEGVEIKGNTVWISDSGNDRIVKYRLKH
ncbi:MAG: NHL repeat-containing protein [Acidiferrobacterales bacterium]|nr:NHL repeat-containing protein [Acidiferrobacterales bacterium]